MGWKEIEGIQLKGIPITSLLGDNLRGELMVSDDPMLDTLMKSLQEIVIVYRIGDASTTEVLCL